MLVQIIVRKSREQQGTKRKDCCREEETRQREKREGEQEEARNSKDVQKQDSTRKVVEALSQYCCKCLLGPFRTWSLAKYPNAKAPQHTPTMPCVWPWWLGPRSRPELRGCGGGGRGGGGLGGLGRALRCPHSGLVEPLSQVLLILPNIVL